MLTVTKLARRCGLSRSTLLYYESIGLLKATLRSTGNYRVYRESDVHRLEQVCVYRRAGIKLENIRAILDRSESDVGAVLRRRLAELDAEIETRRGHQRAILMLLGEGFSGETETMTKEKWVSIMKASGFDEAQMRRWHEEFERSAPEDHEEFLRYLNIPAEEAATIREWSRKGGK